MIETFSIRIDLETKRRLGALSKRLRRSKSSLGAEAIAAFVESEDWQVGEIQAGIDELESGQGIKHEKVSKWLKSCETACILTVNGAVDTPPLVTTTETGPIVLSSGVRILSWSSVHAGSVTALQ